MELVLILTIAVVLFGASRLGEVGGAMGKSIREFKKASAGDDDEKRLAEAKAESKTDAATSG
jgi:sec-independent protein translocase protein TatA